MENQLASELSHTETPMTRSFGFLSRDCYHAPAVGEGPTPYYNPLIHLLFLPDSQDETFAVANSILEANHVVLAGTASSCAMRYLAGFLYMDLLSLMSADGKLTLTTPDLKMQSSDDPRRDAQRVPNGSDSSPWLWQELLDRVFAETAKVQELYSLADAVCLLSERSQHRQADLVQEQALAQYQQEFGTSAGSLYEDLLYTRKRTGGGNFDLLIFHTLNTELSQSVRDLVLAYARDEIITLADLPSAERILVERPIDRLQQALEAVRRNPLLRLDTIDPVEFVLIMEPRMPGFRVTVTTLHIQSSQCGANLFRHTPLLSEQGKALCKFLSGLCEFMCTFCRPVIYPGLLGQMKVGYVEPLRTPIYQVRGERVTDLTIHDPEKLSRMTGIQDFGTVGTGWLLALEIMRQNAVSDVGCSCGLKPVENRLCYGGLRYALFRCWKYSRPTNLKREWFPCPCFLYEGLDTPA